MSDALKGLVADHARVGEEIARLTEKRYAIYDEINGLAYEIRDAIESRVRVEKVVAYFVDGIMRAHITLPGDASEIVRDEYMDGIGIRTGWMLVNPGEHRTPLAPIDPEYARWDDLRRTKRAQEIVGWSTIETLVEIEKEFAFCMFFARASPANYARVRERVVAGERTELFVD